MQWHRVACSLPGVSVPAGEGRPEEDRACKCLPRGARDGPSQQANGGGTTALRRELRKAGELKKHL